MPHVSWFQFHFASPSSTGKLAQSTIDTTIKDDERNAQEDCWSTVPKRSERQSRRQAPKPKHTDLVALMPSEQRDWERELEEDRRQTETFRRLHRLYKRGFRPDWRVTDVEDAIWWTHPGGYPDLILYPNGILVVVLELAVLNGREVRIHNTSTADNAMFDEWLASVKPPTWWQAGAAARYRYIIMPLFLLGLYAVFFAIVWSAEKVLKWLWRAFVG